MKNAYCAVLASLMVASGGRCEAAGLGSVHAVVQMLETGQPVSVAMDLSLCQPATTQTHPTKTRGGLRINAYREMEDGTLVFADDHFTIGRGGKPIRQFLRYKVHPDGSAEFSMTVFGVPDTQKIGPTLEYKCAINKGIRFTT